MKLTQDVVLGLVFMAIGLFAFYIALSYPMGTASRMGPGYFPIIISVLLTGIGLALVVRSRFMASETFTGMPLRPMVLVSLAIVLFGAVVKGLGMPAAVLVLVVVSATSSIRFKPDAKASVGAVAFAAVSTVIFVSFLHMSMPVVGSWLQDFGL